MNQRLLLLLPVAALAVAGCASDGDAISIDDAWARATAEGQTVGAVYFDVTVADDDTLVAASVPASVAAEAQIHEVVPADDTTDGGMDAMDEMSGEMDGTDDGTGSDEMDEMSGEMDMGGAMRMQELSDGLPLAGGETVSLEPGGYHVMLLDLAEPLEVGDEVELTLEFAEAGSTTFTVEVAETSP